MMKQSLLFREKVEITDHIHIVIPKLGDILEREGDYYSMVSLITATPYDMMVQLDDMGIDFETLEDYDLFLLMFDALKSQDTSLIFGDLDLKGFHTGIHPQNKLVVLHHPETNAVIDRGIYDQICKALRQLHHLTRNHKTPGNQAAKDYILQKARKKLKRRMSKEEDSMLEALVVALVNTEQFSYDYGGVQGLTIYQFNESLKQIMKKVDYDNRMQGVYAGTLKVSDLSQDDLNWLTHK